MLSGISLSPDGIILKFLNSGTYKNNIKTINLNLIQDNKHYDGYVDHSVRPLKKFCHLLQIAFHI